MEALATVSTAPKISKRVQLNSSQLTDIAKTATDIHSKELIEPVLQQAEPVSRIMTVVDSTNNPADVDLASSTNNSDNTMMQKSGDQYFPIQLTLPSNNTPTSTTTGATPMTEDEKRKKAIMIASIILLMLIVLVAIVSRKKAGK